MKMAVMMVAAVIGVPACPATAMDMPENHTKKSVSLPVKDDHEEMDILFGPLMNSTNTANDIHVETKNAEVTATFDRGYAFLITTREKHTTVKKNNVEMAIPVYWKTLRSQTTQISSPGSKIMIQILDSDESSPDGPVCERAFLRNEDGLFNNKRHCARVKLLGPTIQPPVELDEDTGPGRGQYVNIIRVDGGYAMSAAKDLPTNGDMSAEAVAVRAFLKWADDNADDADMDP